MGKSARIEGLDDCLSLFDRFPENMLKIEHESMKIAAKAAAAHMRRKIPKRFRRLTKYKVYAKGRTGSYALVGLYNRHEVSGKQSESGDPAFDWFKAYWANYGTLSRRDPSHEFKFKIKPKSSGNRRRQSVGQPPQKFFEAAAEGWKDVYMEAFEREFDRRKDELYNR